MYQQLNRIVQQVQRYFKYIYKNFRKKEKDKYIKCIFKLWCTRCTILSNRWESKNERYNNDVVPHHINVVPLYLSPTKA